MKRILLCVLGTVLVSPSMTEAQITLGEPALDLARIEDQMVPIVFSVEREAADIPPEGSAIWVFARFESPEIGIGDVRWAAEGHSARGEGNSSPLEVIPATGGPFIPGVILETGLGAPDAGSWTVELIWDYSSSQINMPEAGLPVHLMAVEMVLIPGGPFAVGDGIGSEETSTFYSASGDAVRIESGGPISVGEGAELFYDASDYGGDRAGPIPEAFPTGFEPFYIMRRELTDGQYAAFLNTLSGRALAARDITREPGYAEAGGSISTTGGYVAAQSDRPASHITWADGIAWAAWAGLRPMTELEFEKTARDPTNYGVEALLGGRWERVVTVGTPEGRAFRGTHGWGFVDGLGQPHMFANWDWPAPTALGSGFRGGFTGYDVFAAPGNRVYAAYDATYGGENEGFRAVRTAPTPSQSGLD